MRRDTQTRIGLWIAVALAGVSTSACGERPLLSGVSRAEARRCQVALEAAGLDVSVASEGTDASGGLALSLRGDEADYRTAMQVLDGHGLPRRDAGGFATESAGLIPSAAEERARFVKGLAGEIATMLESVDGVVEAQVVVSVPERKPLQPDAVDAPSASVVVSHTGDASPVSEYEVRQIVVRAVGSTIDVDRVTVLLKPVLRSGPSKPAVRYERDRVTEAAFGLAVLTLGALQTATVWRMRRARRSSVEARPHGD